MSYEDFTKRIWKVCKSTDPDRCQAEEIVIFKGPDSAVVVQCSESHPYDLGRYFSEADVNGERIERTNDYTIRIIEVEPKYKIQASFSDLVGGSWTAEDNTGGSGDG